MGWGDLLGRPGGRVAMAVIYLAVWRDKRAKFQTEVEGGSETVSSNFQTARKKADCFEREWPFRKEAAMPRHAYCGRRGAALWVIF